MTDSMKSQIAEHQRVVAAAVEHIGLLERIADRIIAGFQAGGRLYALGNGGSAADAQHIAAELMGRFKQDRKALPAVSAAFGTGSISGNVQRTVRAIMTGHKDALGHDVAGWAGFAPRDGNPSDLLAPATVRGAFASQAAFARGG